MKRHLIDIYRAVPISGTTDSAIIYHTWCNWETLDKRTLDLGDGKNLDPLCKRCTAAIAKLNRDSYPVPIDGE